MSTDTNIFPIRIHCHLGRVVLSHSDGYLGRTQAFALAAELRSFAGPVQNGRHPATRLVLADGRRVTESTGKPTYVFV